MSKTDKNPKRPKIEAPIELARSWIRAHGDTPEALLEVRAVKERMIEEEEAEK